MLAYRLTDPFSRRTIAVSEAARERYVRLRAVPTRKAGVIANGIETANFLPNPERRAVMRAATGVTEQDFVWIAVGRLAPAKDYPNLLRAFAQVPDAQLWIAGAGDPSYTNELRAHARELGIESKVHWLGARQDVPSLLDAADAFVLASAWEGMPLALGEAMAMAKPVVATNVGGIAQLAGSTSWLVPAGNSGALAERMARMMALSDKDRLKIGEAARARIQEQFSMEAKAREWEAIYCSIQQ
jgi:glycosyltransferase involved in cell wall biosynthesis